MCELFGVFYFLFYLLGCDTVATYRTRKEQKYLVCWVAVIPQHTGLRGRTGVLLNDEIDLSLVGLTFLAHLLAYHGIGIALLLVAEIGLELGTPAVNEVEEGYSCAIRYIAGTGCEKLLAGSKILIKACFESEGLVEIVLLPSVVPELVLGIADGGDEGDELVELCLIHGVGDMDYWIVAALPLHT